MNRVIKTGTLAFLGIAVAGAVTFVSLAPETGIAQNVQAIEKRLLAIAKERKLSAEDLLAAASTYTPAGKDDEFVCLNSGGQASSVVVYGVPSMRILKYIANGAPDSASGYGFDVQSKAIHRQGYMETQSINWGDTHHPSFSETDGKYDGRFAFINDKANPRIFVMDLRDLETKQIVPNPLFRSGHGGAFVTPNTEYIIESAQYPAPLDRKYYALNQANFNEHFRGGITFHKFDNEKGRIDPSKSFTVIAPPYTQDLSDAGKGESFGYSFTNSLCSERYIGGIELGRPPFEAGCSAKDVDLMHVVDWKKAEKLIAAGKGKLINNHMTLPMDVAAAEGVLVLIPEPKSPHGVDVSPDGRFIVVAGKLDTHATIFDIRKIKQLIADKEYAGLDPYGIPILDMKKAMHGQVEIGLGPLHTQFDPKEGIAYTSVYIDSTVAKWDYLNLKVLDTVSVHYNIGHLVSMQGDSQDPRGKYVIALNKLAIDRFSPVGPLHPQNHQLIDVSGDKMRLIYDLPLPMGEPHYTVCIDAKDLKTLDKYPVGTDTATMQISPNAVAKGGEKIVRKGTQVEVFATVSAAGMRPLRVDVNQGDEVSFHITNLEETPDHAFKFTVGGYNALGVLPAGRAATVRFVASQGGLFNFKADAIDSPYETREFGLLSVKPGNHEKVRQGQLKVAAARAIKFATFTTSNLDQTGGLPGEAEFNTYGCGGCHQKGRETGGPDLTDVVVRRDEAWLVRWITEPELMYEDPIIVPQIAQFGVKMPNQGVSAEDAKKMIEYVRTWSSASEAVAATAGAGEQIYRRSCFACHDGGVGGAPKLGDTAEWMARLKQGDAVVLKHAVDGFQGKAGYMPPRGACSNCTDDNLRDAVRFMTGQGK
jgi:nitrous-oxide reductase